MGKPAKVRYPCPGAAKATSQAASDANGITACSRSVERSDTTGYDRQTNGSRQGSQRGEPLAQRAATPFGVAHP